MSRASPGGESRGFEATFRALAYSGGAGALVALVPLCGAPLGLGLAAISAGLALAGAHDTANAKGLVAALLPFFLMLTCCGGVVSLLLSMLTALSAAAQG